MEGKGVGRGVAFVIIEGCGVGKGIEGMELGEREGRDGGCGVLIGWGCGRASGLAVLVK